MSSLSQKLSAALKSRDERLIRRRLPDHTITAQPVIDFSSNDYLSLADSIPLRNAVLAAFDSAPNILGSGGSRLLVPAPAHVALEARLCRFFDAPSALLFNSGFDANTGFFSAVPQPGDVVLYDEHIHASVHEGMRTSRLPPNSLISFAHNSVPALEHTLSRLIQDRKELKTGRSSVFIAVESLYSMDGTFAPLVDIVDCVEKMLPLGNGYVVVDEAHATGIYGPNGRGMVAALGLEKRIFARLHTFGKSLAAAGAVMLTTELVRDYLLNYARSLIYTTALTNASVIAVGCSFDMLENGTAGVLAAHLLDLSAYFVSQLRTCLRNVPSSLLQLPDHLSAPSVASSDSDLRSGSRKPWHPATWDTARSNTMSSLPQEQFEKPTQNVTSTLSSPPFSPSSPIIPLLTPEPRSLSNFLLSFSPPEHPGSKNFPESVRSPVIIHTKPIFPPTVPAGTSRVRICLHAGHSREDVDILLQGIIAWTEHRMAEMRRKKEEWKRMVLDTGVSTWMEAKL
ncbi:pyridoxal phosphate-dependent transferase [Scleroderma yunnanense]